MESFGASQRPLVLVAARMTSSRLPSKALMEFGGQPLLGYVVAAVSAASGISGVVVTTSSHPTDDAIARWCSTQQVHVWRGDLHDVASRMLGAAAHYGASGFVRISGDSPMIDPHIISHGATQFASADVDIVTNVSPRTFPPGQSVEVVRAEALERLLRLEDVGPHDHEHVTPVLYKHARALRILSFGPSDVASTTPEVGATYGAMSIDSPTDADCFREVLQSEGRPDIWNLGWQRCGKSMALARQKVGANSELSRD